MDESSDSIAAMCAAHGPADYDGSFAEGNGLWRLAADRLHRARRQRRGLLRKARRSRHVRTEAYEKLQNPLQMLSARYIAQIAGDFSGDIGEPIGVIKKMTDRAALEYISENAALEYFRDLAKDRLTRIKSDKSRVGFFRKSRLTFVEKITEVD